MMKYKWVSPRTTLAPTSFADLGDEVEQVLESWVEDKYSALIDTTEFLDSSRVKQND